MKMLSTLAVAALLAGLLIATANAAPHEAIVIQKEEPAAQKQDAPAQKLDAQTQKQDTQVQQQAVQAQKPGQGEKSVQVAPRKPGTSLVERYDKRREVKKRAAERRKALMQEQQNKGVK